MALSDAGGSEEAGKDIWRVGAVLARLVIQAGVVEISCNVFFRVANIMTDVKAGGGNSLVHSSLSSQLACPARKAMTPCQRQTAFEPAGRRPGSAGGTQPATFGGRRVGSSSAAAGATERMITVSRLGCERATQTRTVPGRRGNSPAVHTYAYTHTHTDSRGSG